MTSFDFEDPLFVNTTKKLQQLDCALIGNGEDWWLYDLLLSSETHRFQLLEWVLSKLKCNFLKVSQQHGITDEYVKSLLSIFANLGFCRSTDKNLIMGKTTKKVQLHFWNNIFSILLEKSNYPEARTSINQDESEDERDSLVTEENPVASLEETYQNTCEFIRSLSSGVNMSDLFMEKVNILPPDVKKDVENVLSNFEATFEIPDLGELRSRIRDRSSDLSVDFRDSQDSLELPEEYCMISLTSTEDDKVEEKLKAAIEESCVLAKDFHYVYSELKPYLKDKVDAKSSDIGPSFKNLHTKQKSVSEVFTDLTAAKSSYLEICNGCEVLESYDMQELTAPNDNTDVLSCSTLKSYTENLQEGLKQTKCFHTVCGS